jgi:hypothetical protein
MIEDHLNTDSNVVRLADKLSSDPNKPDSCRLDELLTGISSERERLGRRRFLAILNQKEFDIDGLTDWIFLLESFDCQDAARTYIDQTAKSLREQQLASSHEYGMPWHPYSQDEIRYLSQPDAENWAHPIRVFADRTYALRATPYDTKYNCFRVIGPFHDEIVGDNLITFTNEQFELWSYFVSVGEAMNRGESRTRPH